MSETVAVGGVVVLLLAELLAFGASEFAVSAVFSVLHALALVVLLASCGWARKAAGALVWPSAWWLFLGLIVALAWGLTPWGPGGPHPVWKYLGDRGGSITVDRSALVLSILRLCGLACLFLAAQIIGASETRRRALVWSVLVAVGLYAALAIGDHVGLRARPRLTATLLSPNSAATLMGLGLVTSAMFLSQFIQRAGGAIRLDKLPMGASVSLGLAAVFAVALALTASRGGIFATVVALAVLLTWEVLAQGRKIRAIAIVGGAAALLVVVGVAMRSAELTATRLETLDSDMAVRQTIFTAHWLAFKSSPWFGFGLGSFPSVNQLIMTTETLPVLFDVRATHNLYLQWLEEAGIVGSLFMAGLLGVVIARIAPAAIKSGGGAGLARAVIACVVLVLLHGLSDFAVQAPALQALFAMGLGAVAAPTVSRGTRMQSRWWPTMAFGGVAAAACLLAAAPLAAARLGGDLSAMPTAPAEALATNIEAGLFRGPRTPADLARLERLSARELAMRPGTGSAWLRKAAIDFDKGDVPAANVALSRSYAVAPLQTSLFWARTRIAYEHWDSLSQDVRDQVVYQARVEYHRPNGDGRLVEMARSLRNPTGQTGLALLILAERSAKAAAQ